MARSLAVLLLSGMVFGLVARGLAQDDDPTIRGKKLSEWLKLDRKSTRLNSSH